MKIDHGATPIFVSPRRVGGVEIIQGRSRVKLTPGELRDLIAILTNMSTSDAQGAREVTTIEHHQ